MTHQLAVYDEFVAKRDNAQPATTIRGEAEIASPSAVDVDVAVQELAQALLPQTSTIAARVTERLIVAVPEVLPPSVPEALEAVRESNVQNVGAVLSMLAFGMNPAAVEPPTGTLKILRHLATAEVDLLVVLRAYRHAHAYTWDAWADHVHDQNLPPAILRGVLLHSTRCMFEYFDSGAGKYVARHRQEFPVLSGGHGRRLLIEDVLRGHTIDVPRTRHELGYDLSGPHLALVLAPLHDLSEATAATEVLSTFDPQMPVLIQPQADGSTWLWFSSRQPLGEEKLREIERLSLENVLVGMGEPGRGTEGFRRSHAQAEQALRVARLRSRSSARTTRYRDVEQVILLTADPVRAREFSVSRLAALAERSEAASKLRSTLRIYLDNDCNKARVADIMSVHQKTVAYRLIAAEEALGHPISGAAIDLAAALLIDLALHGE